MNQQRGMEQQHSMNQQLGQWIELPKITDPRGNLTVVEQCKDVHFEIKRAYWVYDVPAGESRGGHAHKALHFRKASYLLNHPWEGLLIEPGIWRTLDDFSSGAVCMVLADELYDESDYIYDYQDFLAYKASNP